MADLKSITQIGSNSGDLIKINQLEDLLEKQQVFIQNLLNDKKSLEDKIKHLEAITLGTNKDLLLSISAEELICTEQISILKNKSLEKELTSDEAKRLQIYVQTLQAIRKEVTLNIKKENLQAYTDEDLLAIAKNDNLSSDE